MARFPSFISEGLPAGGLCETLPFEKPSLKDLRKMAINRRTVLLALLLVGVVFALHWWFRSPPSRARQLRPLLTEIDGYRATNGAYPTSCVSFASFSQLTQHCSVYTGRRETNGIIWETREVSDHDFTVMVDRQGYEVFLPVGRMKPISFTSFPVWRYDSAEHRWQKGRIHWSYATDYSGSYWSKE